jgi:hypothetical protein
MARGPRPAARGALPRAAGRGQLSYFTVSSPVIPAAWCPPTGQ